MRGQEEAVKYEMLQAKAKLIAELVDMFPLTDQDYIRTRSVLPSFSPSGMLFSLWTA
jgi:hypothetical protein